VTIHGDGGAVFTVRTDPVIGLFGQFGVFAALAGTVGLGPVGWTAGTAYAAVLWVVLTRAMQRSGTAALGPADRVTLIRATLVGGVTTLVADSLLRPAPVLVVVVLAAVALALDAVDGRVARRTRTVSPLGARFDMEVDAFLILVLSVHIAGRFGGWVFAIGAMRYAFVAATWVLPWLRGSAPPRYWCKVVAAATGIVLAVATADLVPRRLMALALAVSLGMLIESFGRDVVWLWQRRVIESGHARGGRVLPARV
jgi:phosphatidylglycerophosphate synthase